MSCVAAVRTLCEFTARAGDLDLRFTPAPTGQEGVAGHVVTAGAAPAMKPRLPCPANTANCWCAAAPTATTPPPSAWKRSRPIVDAWTACARTTAPRTGRRPRSTAICCARRAACQPDGGAGVFQRRHRRGNHAGRDASGGRAGGVLQRAVRALPGLGAAGQAHRGARDAALAALRFPHEFRSGQRELAVAPTGARWRLPAGAGADRHRQNAGHLVSAAQGRARGRPGQAVLPGRQGAGPRARCRRWTR